MKVLVEVGPNLHLFDAVAVSIEGNEIDITLPTLELVVVETSEEVASYVKNQLKKMSKPIYINADRIKFSHVLLTVEVEEK